MIDHRTGTMPGDRLSDFDFESHNAEVRECYAALYAGKPTRVPIIVGTNTRYFMRNPAANPESLQFERFSEHPDIMFDALLRFQRWSRYNVLQDAELGLPDVWQIVPDFQNYYDAAWFGCPVEYMSGEVPDTRPVYGTCPEALMDRGVPDPFGGFMGKVLRYHERFRERAASETYLGRPIRVGTGCGLATDGVMTTACNLFGPVFVCSSMAAEPERMQGIFKFVTDSLVAKMTAWRRLEGVPIPQDGFGSADDSIALISTAMYREQILGHHKRLFDTFATPAPRSLHLCGNATRHFITIRDELNVTSFDTGFPVDFGKLRRDLGPAVRILGGPHVELLRSQSPEVVRAEVKRILGTGILDGGQFILREGNNLAPETPLENTDAMYHAGREFGRYAA